MAKTVTLKKDMRRSEIGGRYLMNPGGFLVMVDGKEWGRVVTHSLGPRGLRYDLMNLKSQRVRIHATGDGGSRDEFFWTWSDKLYLRNLKPDEKQVSLMDRLLAMAERAIAKNALRDPEFLKAEETKRQEKNRLAETERRQAQDREWRAKAAEAIGNAKFSLTAVQRADLEGRIVDAMKWAQTR